MPVRIKHPDKDSTTVQQSAIPRVLLKVAHFLQGSYTAFYDTQAVMRIRINIVGRKS